MESKTVEPIIRGLEDSYDDFAAFLYEKQALMELHYRTLKEIIDLGVEKITYTFIRPGEPMLEPVKPSIEDSNSEIAAIRDLYKASDVILRPLSNQEEASSWRLDIEMEHPD